MPEDAKQSVLRFENVTVSFDGTDALIHAETLTLPYTGWGPTFQYGFAGTIYQGSAATPGSVSPRPDARKVQWRLYYAIDYQVCTDAILYQVPLAEDAVISGRG